MTPAGKCTGCSMPDWSSLLASCREAQERPSRPPEEEVEYFLANFPRLAELLSQYASSCGADELDRGSSFGQGGEGGEPDASRQRKNQILNVRRALRFCLSCTSLGNDGANDADSPVDNPVQAKVQEEAIVTCKLHISLSCLLSHRDVDKKSRIMAAQLLSNLVTANTITADVVAKDVALSHAEPSGTRAVSDELSLVEGGGNNKEHDAKLSNWVDIISASACAGDRGSVAAVVAALHNCISALGGDDEVKEPYATCKSMAASASLDRALMCNLVQYILPVGVVKPNEGKAAASSNVKKIVSEDSSCDEILSKDDCSQADDATEWISLLLEKFSSLGFFPQMYQSLGRSTDSETSHNSAHGELVTPEQVVLLHCLGRSVEEAMHPSNLGQNAQLDPLGGSGGEEAVTRSYRFLSKQVGSIRRSMKSSHRYSDLEDMYAGETECREAAYLSMLEMLATSLSGDGADNQGWKALSRVDLGRDTGLLSDALVDLGAIVDRLAASNRGAKARELKMAEEDQRMVTVLVRLVGNLCYQCRYNQDKLRTVDVPFYEDGTGGRGAFVGKEDVSGSFPLRTGLHVLLSCTSFSYGCFTLREWAIVAIRNALEGNEENQRLVEELEAQKAVDTPELQKMGVTIQLDGKGQIRFSCK